MELTSTPQMFLTKICSSFSSWSTSFLVSISSRFVHKVKTSSFVSTSRSISSVFTPPTATLNINFIDNVDAVVSPSCSLSTLITKSIFVRDSVKHQEASEEFLTPPRRGSGDQESSALRRQHVSHQESEENQESDAEVRESVHEDSDSSVHGQRHVPPQNHESTSQWSSWIRSCLSVSVSLRSLSWRRQDQGRNQEDQEEINQ